MGGEMDKWRNALAQGEKAEEPRKIQISNYGRVNGPFPKGFFHAHSELLRKIFK